MVTINKVIVVEGKRDKLRLLEEMDEPVHIICTHGTMCVAKLDALLEEISEHQVFIMTDQDKAGKQIRRWFTRHLSESQHIYVDSTYGEVSNCPHEYLKKLLDKHGFLVKDWNVVDDTKLFNFTFAH